MRTGDTHMSLIIEPWSMHSLKPLNMHMSLIIDTMVHAHNMHSPELVPAMHTHGHMLQ